MAGVPIFRSRVSAVRYLVRVFRFGCRIFHSVLHSVLNAALNSVLPDRFSHPSSAIDPALFLGAGWRDFCPPSSIQPSTQSSTQSSISSHSYVVTRSRPYPRQLGQHAVLPLPQDIHSPDTRYSILDTLIHAPSGHYFNCYGNVTDGKHLRDGLAATCLSSTHII